MKFSPNKYIFFVLFSILSICSIRNAFAQTQTQTPSEKKAERQLSADESKIRKVHVKIGLSYCMHYSKSLKPVYSSYYSFKKPFNLLSSTYHDETFLPFYFALSYSFKPEFDIGFSFLPLNKIKYYGEHVYKYDVVFFFFPLTMKVGREVSEVISASSFVLDFRYNFFKKSSRNTEIKVDVTAGPKINFHNVKTILTVLDTINYTNEKLSEKFFTEKRQTYGIMGNVEVEVLLSRRISYFLQINGGASSRFTIAAKSYSPISQEIAMVPEHSESLIGIGATLGIIIHL